MSETISCHHHARISAAAAGRTRWPNLLRPLYSNTVSVIDTDTNAVIGSRIPVGESPAAFGPFIQPTVKFGGTPGLENCVRQSIKTLERRYGSLDATAKVLGYDGPPALRKAIRRYCG